MPRAERGALDELDVAAAPPAVALAPGHVRVSAGPTPALAAVAVRADPGRLLAVGPGGEGLRLFDLILFELGLGRDGLGGRMGDGGLRHVMEGAGEGFARLEALLAVFRGRLPDDLHDRGGNRGRRARLVEHLGVEDRGQLARERWLAVQQLVQDHSQRVDVSRGIDRVAFDLLGRHVGRRADHAAGGGQPVLVVDQLGDSEVEDLGLAPVRDQDVVRLEVAMDDLVVVRDTDRRQQLLDQVD